MGWVGAFVLTQPPEHHQKHHQNAAMPARFQPRYFSQGSAHARFVRVG